MPYPTQVEGLMNERQKKDLEMIANAVAAACEVKMAAQTATAREYPIVTCASEQENRLATFGEQENRPATCGDEWLDLEDWLA
jgi:hypothetical protein